jgi:hypothetical protein
MDVMTPQHSRRTPGCGPVLRASPVFDDITLMVVRRA